MANRGGEKANSAEQKGVKFSVSKDIIDRIIHSKFPGSELINYEVKRGSNVGDNFTCDIMAVVVNIKPTKGQPETVRLAIKTFPQSPMRQMVVNNGDLFNKECFFYNKLIPELKTKSGSAADWIHLTCPRLYLASSEGTNSFLAMENLKWQGYKMVDCQAGLDHEHVELVMRELGMFHATTTLLLKGKGSRDNVLKDYPGLKDVLSGTGGQWLVGAMAAMVPHVVNVLKNRHKKTDAEIKPIKELEEKLGQLLGRLTSEVIEPWAVVCHGDCWLNNFLFRYQTNLSGKEIPVELKMVDWQMTRYSSPCTDIAFCLYICVGTKFRNENLLRLLQIYHRSFTETLKQLGLDSTKYTFESLWKDWLAFRKYGFIYGILFGLMHRAPRDMIHDMDSIDESAGQEFVANYFGSLAERFSDEILAIFEDGKAEGII